MATRPQPDPVELFVGQMIALLPKEHDPDDPVLRTHQQRLFPPADAPAPPPEDDERPPRPRTYSLIVNGRGGGTLTVGGAEIQVAILPLDVDTPPGAAAFRVAAIAGRALNVTGVDEGEGAG